MRRSCIGRIVKIEIVLNGRSAERIQRSSDERNWRRSVRIENDEKSMRN